MEQLPESARTILVTVNPKAGDGSRQRKIAHLIEELSRRGFNTQQIPSLDQLAIEAEATLRRGELRAVIAAGGDGTVAEIANRTRAGTPLAVFPLGTENLLAKYLEMSHDCAAFAEVIAAGRTTWIDAGRANGRIFLLMTGVGFDAEVVQRLHTARKGHIRHLSYLKPIWQALRKYKYPELRVYGARHDEPWSEPICCRWAFVFNVPRYGMGLQFVPEASATDGQLDLCTFERGGLMAGLNYLIAVVRGRHRQLDGCAAWRGERLRIESAEPVPYELDGDPGGTLPVEIETLPRQIHLLVPPDSSLARQNEPPSSG
jgi:YegS/Rv2252/BmrU family lipid kinase